MDETKNYKECPEYFGNGFCALNLLWCPHWAKENGIYVPRGCEDMVSGECIHEDKEDEDVLP